MSECKRAPHVLVQVYLQSYTFRIEKTHLNAAFQIADFILARNNIWMAMSPELHALSSSTITSPAGGFSSAKLTPHAWRAISNL